MPVEDVVLKKFSETGVGLRMICEDYDVYSDDENEGEPQFRSLNDELDVLLTNRTLLNKAGVHTAEALRRYYVTNRFDGFLSRPATVIKQGFPIETYHNGLGLITFYDHKNTRTFDYDVISHRALHKTN